MIRRQFFTVRILAFTITVIALLGQSHGQDLHWSTDGKQVWFQQLDDSGILQFHFVDVENRSSQIVMDQSWFEQQNGKIAVTDIYPTEQPSIFLIQAGRTLYQIDCQNKTSELINPALIQQHRPRLFLPPKSGPRGKSNPYHDG